MNGKVLIWLMVSLSVVLILLLFEQDNKLISRSYFFEHSIYRGRGDFEYAPDEYFEKLDASTTTTKMAEDILENAIGKRITVDVVIVDVLNNHGDSGLGYGNLGYGTGQYGGIYYEFPLNDSQAIFEKGDKVNLSGIILRVYRKDKLFDLRGTVINSVKQKCAQ